MRLRRVAAAAVAAVLLIPGLARADKLSARDWQKLQEDVAEWAKDLLHEAPKATELLQRTLKDQSARSVQLAGKIVEIQEEDAFALTAGEALAKLLDQEPVRKEIQKQASAAKPWRARLACVDACGRELAKKGCRPIVDKALEDPQAEVGMHAVRLLARAKQDDAVETLVTRFEKLDGARGPVWEELREALGDLLGKRLETGALARGRWNELKTKGGLKGVDAAPPPAEEPAPTPGGSPRTVSFFGRELRCSRIVFILDVSESMLAVDDPNLELPPGGTTSAPPPGSTEKVADPRSRIERAKRELIRVLKALPKDARVNIIAFSSFNRLWRGSADGKPPKLHALDEKTLADACEFVKKLEATGATATDDALDRAFQIEGPRCFYLLSDGEPTKDGKTRIPTETILDLIAAKNKDRGIRIQTMGFKGADPEFMRAVAKATGGEYSDIK